MSIAVPQQYFTLSSIWLNDVELDVVVDTSTKAYGTVSWLCHILKGKLLLFRDGKFANSTNEGTNPATAAVIGARSAQPC